MRRTTVVIATGAMVASLCAVLGGGGSAYGDTAVPTGLSVFVGYADNLRAGPKFFPSPWDGSSNVTFEGCSPLAACTFDAGAVRVVNNTVAPVNVSNVAINVGGCVFKMWAGPTLAPGHELIVTQTASGAGDGCPGSSPITSSSTMDTSDIGPGGRPEARNCTPDNITPTVSMDLDGIPTSFDDSSLVLNTGGFDIAECPSGTNESLQWSLIGTRCPRAILTLGPPSQSVSLPGPVSVEATLTNSCGTPLQNNRVDFSVVSGPDAGLNGSATTDAAGVATFTYSGRATGTDIEQASVTNTVGTFMSNTANVIWHKANPTVATTPSASVAAGQKVSDTATLTGGAAATGKITFTLFGPGDTNCTTALATTTATVDGDGTYFSGDVTAPLAGLFNWVARYDGDDNDEAVASGCGSETVSVTKALPTISTTPSGSVPAGATVSDTAVLADGASPTGAVTFSLFGPGDTNCATALATTMATVNGNGTYFSGDVVAATAGTYKWVATYSGDGNNKRAVSRCGAETVVVTKANPTVATTPSASVPAGGKVSDTAVLADGVSPTGTITFSLFGPGGGCSAAIATRTATVNGNGTYRSGDVVVETAGSYNWIASYGGDGNNKTAASRCGTEKVTVTPQIMTGRAFGISLRGLLSVQPTPDTGPVATPRETTTTTPCTATLIAPTIFTAHVLCANVTTALHPSRSTATASVNDTRLTAPSVPAVIVGAVQATSITTCTGSSGTTTIASLQVGNTAVVQAPTPVTPNTTISLGLVKIVLNEQIPLTGPDKGLTVNAVHITFPDGGAIIDLIVASASSDIGNCPSS